MGVRSRWLRKDHGAAEGEAVVGPGLVPAVEAEAVAGPALVAAVGAEVRAGARVVHDQGQTKDQGHGQTEDQDRGQTKDQGRALNQDHHQNKRIQKMISYFHVIIMVSIHM